MCRFAAKTFATAGAAAMSLKTALREINCSLMPLSMIHVGRE
jgi:hypothetical protein